VNLLLWGPSLLAVVFAVSLIAARFLFRVTRRYFSIPLSLVLASLLAVLPAGDLIASILYSVTKCVTSSADIPRSINFEEFGVSIFGLSDASCWEDCQDLLINAKFKFVDVDYYDNVIRYRLKAICSADVAAECIENGDAREEPKPRFKIIPRTLEPLTFPTEIQVFRSEILDVDTDTSYSTDIYVVRGLGLIMSKLLLEPVWGPVHTSCTQFFSYRLSKHLR